MRISVYVSFPGKLKTRKRIGGERVYYKSFVVEEVQRLFLFLKLDTWKKPEKCVESRERQIVLYHRTQHVLELYHATEASALTTYILLSQTQKSRIFSPSRLRMLNFELPLLLPKYNYVPNFEARPQIFLYLYNAIFLVTPFTEEVTKTFRIRMFLGSFNFCQCSFPLQLL